MDSDAAAAPGLVAASVAETGDVPPWAVTAIVEAGRRMHALGLVQATAGNISVRVGPDVVAVTRSGTHKGFLDAGGIMLADLDGNAIGPGRPSAETGLHCQLYRMFPGVGAVVHGHSVAGTVLSMAIPGPITFSGYEVVKAFRRQATHATTAILPVFDNDQDIPRLAAEVEPVIRDAAPLGYMIRGHGAYVWASDMEKALARMEGLEFLLTCELERRKLTR